MFKNLQNKIKNFTSYLLGYDKIYKEVEDKLKQAKNDKERIAILEEGLELSKEAIQKLATENAELRERMNTLEEENSKLKEQIREHEELESVLSGSGSSDGSINSQRQKEREKIVKKIQTSKRSTASERKMLKYLDNIERLETEVKELKQQQLSNNNLEKITQSVNSLTETRERIKQFFIEIKK